MRSFWPRLHSLCGRFFQTVISALLSAINPSKIWTIVILLMAIGAGGHVAVRALGARFGLPVSGFASGFASSAATDWRHGRAGRCKPGYCGPSGCWRSPIQRRDRYSAGGPPCGYKSGYAGGLVDSAPVCRPHGLCLRWVFHTEGSSQGCACHRPGRRSFQRDRRRSFWPQFFQCVLIGAVELRAWLGQSDVSHCGSRSWLSRCPCRGHRGGLTGDEWNI